MDLKLALHRPSGVQDVLVSVDGSVPVAVLAQRLLLADPASVHLPQQPDDPDLPVTLAVSTPAGWSVIDGPSAVAESALRSGLMAAVVPAGRAPGTAGETPVAAVLVVLAGRDQGREFPLRAGAWTVGRGAAADIGLNDRLVSQRHAVLRLGQDVRLTDQNSANGTQIGGVSVASAVLSPDTEVTVGDTVLQVRLLRPQVGAVDRPIVEFNRPPRVEPVFTPLTEDIPEPPEPPKGQAFPFFSVLLLLGLAAVIWYVTRSGLAAVFLALTSMLLVGSILEQALFRRRGHRRAVRDYRAALEAQCERFLTAMVSEGRARRGEQPSVTEVRSAIIERTPVLWTRRPDHCRFGQLRLGTATRPSRNRLAPPAQRGDPALLAEAERAAARFTDVDDVPVTVTLRETGSLGVCGASADRADAARAIVLQLAGLHSPDDLIVSALVPASAADDWAWLRWLPHGAPARLLGGASLGADPESCHRILAAAEQLLLDRLDLHAAPAGGAGTRRGLPVLILVVEDGVPVERDRLVALAEHGGPAGIHLVWSAPDIRMLPAACRTYLDVQADGSSTVGMVDAGELIAPVRPEGVDAGTAESLARLLAPVVDAGAARDRQASLPRSASFVEFAGRDLVFGPAAVAERWRETGSPGAGRCRPATLRALVGQGTDDPVHLDLREHGPHALVGGTTGAGKSEFLQSWILGMAVDHSPERVTFLLVDYKGGAAFAEAVRLPHTVGLVTDLTPRLVRRALASLRAEVRHRERILAAAGAPDLLELERRGDPCAPPALVIVVDEFAALVQEVPEFVDGMIDVAQRGRSLGLHLILATQRPAGVIRDNLRANTNLRVALRMADESDSLDVLGTRDAALFDPGIPGRAMAKTGPGRLIPFQALYAGGRTSSAAPPPEISISTLGFGPAQDWEVPEHLGVAAAPSGATDVHRLVDTIRDSARTSAIGAPRRPWLPELPAAIELAGLGHDQRNHDLPFGMADDPDGQRQQVVSYRPDEDGVMVVLGTGGAGKSATLRALAIAAGEASTGEGGDPYQVYGLDFGSRGLASLDPLPHVGSIVPGDDHERVTRLLDWLRTTVDERADRYAEVTAGTISEYRTIAAMPHEPRILLLVDNFGGFRTAYETSRSSRLYDLLTALALDGRSVGVHVVISADRPGVIPPGVAAAVKKRLALRLVAEMDLATAGVAADAFTTDTPPGRGWLGGLEVQVAVLGGDPDAAGQADRTRSLASRLTASGVTSAPEVGRLTDHVDLSSLLPGIDGMPTLGIAEDTLAEIGFAVSGTFLIAGPPQSGRTTAMLTAVHSLRRHSPGCRLAYFGTRRSPLTGTAGPDWARLAVTTEEAAGLAAEWTSLAAVSAGPALGAVIENIPLFAGTAAQEPLERLIAAFAAAGHVVIGDGESAALTSSWGLPQAMKAGRHGLLLQPDQQDGDSVLRTALPRLLRSQFPPGRGVYVRAGRVRTVQVALPA